jgi:hypothetical protein
MIICQSYLVVEFFNFTSKYLSKQNSHYCALLIECNKYMYVPQTKHKRKNVTVYI